MKICFFAVNRRIALRVRGDKEKLRKPAGNPAIPKQWVVKRSEAGICSSSTQSGTRRLAATFF